MSYIPGDTAVKYYSVFNILPDSSYQQIDLHNTISQSTFMTDTQFTQTIEFWKTIGVLLPGGAVSASVQMPAADLDYKPAAVVPNP